MRKNHLLIIILTAFLVGSTFGSAGIASSNPLVSVDPKVSPRSAGTTIAINITVTNVTETRALYGYDINLTYNPAILNCTGVEEGPFLKQAGSTWWYEPDIRNDKGYVVFGASLLWFMPPPPPGASGNGTLGTITFDVLAEGRSPLDFSRTDLNTMIEEEGTWIPDPIVHDRENGIFSIPGDADGDGYVGSADAGILNGAYGTWQGDPLYALEADFDLDGYIGSADAGLLNGNYGTSAP